MNNIPKPASPLPWERDYQISSGAPCSGNLLIYGHGESGIYPEEEDEVYLIWAANNALRLYEALEDIVEHVNTIAPTMPSAVRMIANRALKAARGEA